MQRASRNHHRLQPAGVSVTLGDVTNRGERQLSGDPL